MGKPWDGDVEQCNYRQDCKDRYLYYSFIERWIIEFDRNDLVIGSTYNGGSY